jgi:homoserine O-acetyltransferase/O-succinyltransferase
MKLNCQKMSKSCSRWFALLGFMGVVFTLVGLPATVAQPADVNYITLAKEGSYVIKNFTFVNGETLPELRINYATWGEPKTDSAGNITNAILLCHGTAGNWQTFGPPYWATKMYGPGQPLDLNKYFIIASDTIGSGKSSKPSDGLRMQFPKYTHTDVVKAQYLLLTEKFAIKHLHAVIGVSFGGRQAWQWSIQYPEFMLGVVPIISSPFPNAGRRGMQDFQSIEILLRDPTWHNGMYTEQPRNLVLATMSYTMLLDGAGHLWEVAPTREKSFQYLSEMEKRGTGTLDANDWIYQLRVADGFDVYSQLDRVKAKVLVINMAGDPATPIELRHIDKALEKLGEKADYLLVKEAPGNGHFAFAYTTDIYAPKIQEFLQKLEKSDKK